MKPASWKRALWWMSCCSLGLFGGCGGAGKVGESGAPLGTCALHFCYLDRDGDGIGGGAPEPSCACGPGWSETGGDCDDDDVARWQNLSCYPDGDADHYGSGDAATVCVGLTCADGQPGWAESAGDCNDNDATVHPMRPEIANGIDDDCDGAIDEAAVTYTSTIYWFTSGATGSSIDLVLTPNQQAELDALAAGMLYAQVYYRKLEESSAPYHAGGLVQATLSGYGSILLTVTDLEALKAYEVRVDLYRRSVIPPLSLIAFTRITPANGCAGDSGSDVPCSNSDVYYTLTAPAGAGALAAARQRVVLAALYENEYFPYESLGSWNDSLQLRFGLTSREAHYSSEFYAWSGRPYLRDLNPCRDGSAPAWLCAGETSPAENSIARLITWFSAYPGAFVVANGQVDFASLRPGDWLAVDATPDQPSGNHSRMFLAYDAAAGRYWFVEGDGSFGNSWGKIDHVVRVGSDRRIDRIQSIGKLNDPSMIDN